MKKVVEIVHDIMRQAAKEGGAAADFTLGQGFDCAVLASCASIHTVYAFDVQLQAIQDARAFLAGKEGADKIRFIHDGHEQMNHYIHEPLQLGVFNFGYYPRGDHAVTTRLDTSSSAVRDAFSLLKRRGVLILVTYPGHEEGRREAAYFESVVSALPSREAECMSIYMSNKKDCPRIYVIEKNR